MSETKGKSRRRGLAVASILLAAVLPACGGSASSESPDEMVSGTGGVAGGSVDVPAVAGSSGGVMQAAGGSDEPGAGGSDPGAGGSEMNTGGVPGNGTGEGGVPPVSSSVFFDDFDGTMLQPGWQVINGQWSDGPFVDAGQLSVTPTQASIWEGDRLLATFTAQTVQASDFSITTTARVREDYDTMVAPDISTHYAALAIRVPGPTDTDPQTHVFWGVGIAEGFHDCNESTDGGTCLRLRSGEIQLEKPPGVLWDHGLEADLRICKIGDEFRFYARPADSIDTPFQEYLAPGLTRPDLNTVPLEVGMSAVTDPWNPDYQQVASFEYFAMDEIASFDDCLN